LVLVTLDECLKVRGDFRHPHIAAPTDFVGNIFRCIARPALIYIETDDAHRVCILAAEQIADDGLKIGRLDIGLAPCKAEPAEITNYQINVLITAPPAQSKASNYS
jgi:hypothetical protein